MYYRVALDSGGGGCFFFSRVGYVRERSRGVEGSGCVVLS